MAAEKAARCANRKAAHDFRIACLTRHTQSAEGSVSVILHLNTCSCPYKIIGCLLHMLLIITAY
ncbi:hypothetical protein KIN20_001897 [Parelaphostrongylus tenuis]|uniref:Uncharacterized protein n=1 Tax=Parelaphostrongylus tenuis TaxID=148309 RepID=A0AAD5QD46_PARTN|nr:hypothetical protein KIN20_001897 [Parelaphostrongylus tenuis]